MQITTLKGEKRDIKPSLLKEIKKVPETILVFFDGNSIIIRESIEEVLDKVVQCPRMFDGRTIGVNL